MHGLLAVATIPDAITFAIAAVVSVVGALGVVLMRNPVHAALMLVLTLFGVAVLFVEEDAQLLAAVQVIVYAGAIVVLFLFVIMLLGVDRQEQVFADGFLSQRFVPVVLGVLVLVEVLLLSHQRWVTGAPKVAGQLEGKSSNVAVLGRSLFTTYLLPFEVTSALLVVAVIGAVVLARRPHRGAEIERPPVSAEPAGAPEPGPVPEMVGGPGSGAEVQGDGSGAAGEVAKAPATASAADGIAEANPADEADGVVSR